MKKISSLLLEGIKGTLRDNDFDYEFHISNFSHMKNIELRRKEKIFSFSEHLNGLIFSLLSDQRPWEPIEENRSKICDVFYNFDKDKMLNTEPNVFEKKICDIKCGNRAIKKQMENLNYNIKVFQKIENDYGSLDKFLTSDSPHKIALELASGNKYKIKQVGYALALEYLRNVGIDAVKPDTHIIRILSHERLGFSEKVPTPSEAVEIIEEVSKETGYSLSYIDALLWLFCADGYGNICSNEPKCNVCRLKKYCCCK